MKYLSSIAKWLPIVIFAGIGVLSVPVCAGTDTVHLTAPHQQTGSAQFVITTASARNDLISGDSALVRIGVSSLIPVTQVGVYLNSVKITSAFKETPAGSHLLQGLVTSLRRGDNTLLVRDEGNPSNATQLVLTDHSITGPILSGPHIRLHELEAALDSASSPRARQPAPTAHAAACARGRAAPRVAPHPHLALPQVARMASLNLPDRNGRDLV